MNPTATTQAKLTRFEEALLEEALHRGYLLDTSRCRRLCLSSRWWKICEREQRPYVRINATRRHASVVVDLLPAATQFSEAALKQIREFFLQYGGPRSILFPGRTQITMYRIPAAGVEELVGELQRRVRPLHNVYPFERRGVSR
jgi:hypothetical protein